jgi:hypothetical protein
MGVALGSRIAVADLDTDSCQRIAVVAQESDGGSDGIES